MTLKDPLITAKRVKTIRHGLDALAQDYKTEKISLDLKHTQALRKLQNEYAERSKSLQHDIESIKDSLAS